MRHIEDVIEDRQSMLIRVLARGMASAGDAVVRRGGSRFEILLRGPSCNQDNDAASEVLRLGSRAAGGEQIPLASIQARWVDAQRRQYEGSWEGYVSLTFQDETGMDVASGTTLGPFLWGPRPLLSDDEDDSSFLDGLHDDLGDPPRAAEPTFGLDGTRTTGDGASDVVHMAGLQRQIGKDIERDELMGRLFSLLFDQVRHAQEQQAQQAQFTQRVLQRALDKALGSGSSGSAEQSNTASHAALGETFLKFLLGSGTFPGLPGKKKKKRGRERGDAPVAVSPGTPAPFDSITSWEDGGSGQPARGNAVDRLMGAADPRELQATPPAGAIVPHADPTAPPQGGDLRSAVAQADPADLIDAVRTRLPDIVPDDAHRSIIEAYLDSQDDDDDEDDEDDL